MTANNPEVGATLRCENLAAILCLNHFSAASEDLTALMPGESARAGRGNFGNWRNLDIRVTPHTTEVDPTR